MQLTCPACGAKYDIDAALIPDGGRRVQCTACDHVWHTGVAATGDAAPARPHKLAVQPPAPEEDEAPAEIKAPPLSDEVRTILREEAEREARLRGQPAFPPAKAPPPAAAPLAPPAAPPVAAPVPPDPDEVNAALRAASHRAAESRRFAPAPPRPRGNFRTGLAAGIGIVALAGALYAVAPQIAQALPQAQPALGSYVEVVDGIRLSLDRAVAGLGGMATDLLNIAR